MAITLIFIIVIFTFRKYSLFILHIILIIVFILQYSGYHLQKLFSKLPKYNRYTICLIFESVPYTITGFTLGFYNIISFLNKYKIRTLILSVLIYKLINNYYV